MTWKCRKLELVTFFDYVLKGLFHPACLARVVSWLAFVCPHFHGPWKWRQQRQIKRRHVQGMLDEIDPLNTAKNDWIDILLLKKEVWIERPNLVNFAKENKSMTPVLSITMLVVTRCYFGFQNTFQTVTILNGSFTQRMSEFIHGNFYLLPGLVSRCFLSLLADFVDCFFQPLLFDWKNSQLKVHENNEKQIKKVDNTCLWAIVYSF